MHIYLSGPMRGMPDHNFPNFNMAAGLLRARGHTVDNPAENAPMDTVEEYMRADLEMVLRSDVIGVLPGWEDSVGAGVELRVAQAVGIPAFEWRHLLIASEWGEGAVVQDRMGNGWQLPKGLQGRIPIAVDLQPIGTPLSMVTETGSDESVCQEADRLVSTDRQGDYGHPLDDFTKTAKMWSAIFGIEIDAAQVPLAMIAVKISRELNKPKRDNLVDICGYAKTLDLVHERRSAEEAVDEINYSKLAAAVG